MGHFPWLCQITRGYFLELASQPDDTHLWNLWSLEVAYQTFTGCRFEKSKTVVDDIPNGKPNTTPSPILLEIMCCFMIHLTTFMGVKQ